MDNNSSTSPQPDWNAWLQENGSRLLLFARQQSRSQEDAEDILQEALIRLARKLADGSFDGGASEWTSYVFASIRRLAIDFGRKEDRRRRREDLVVRDEDGESDGIFADPWFNSASSDDELRKLVEAALKKIPSKFAEVIVLKIWNNMTFQQISDTLEIPMNTIASRYRYGIEQLRRRLEGSQDIEDLRL